MGKGNSPMLLVGIYINWCKYYEKQYGDSTKSGVLYDPSVLPLGMYPEETKIQTRHMQPRVHCSSTYNSQNVETTQCSVTEERMKRTCYMHRTERHSAVKEHGLE